MDALGARMHSFGVALKGTMTEVRWLAFLQAVVSTIGMSAVTAPSVFTYPVDGKGGNGQTVFLPITESFLALDTWADHDGAYLFICSCKPFDGAAVDNVAAEFGLTSTTDSGGRFSAELNLT